MVTGARWAAVLAAVGAVAMGARAEAGTARRAVVVLHVTDYVSVQTVLLQRAQTAASKVYAQIGVEVEWTTGWAALAPPDGAQHFDVVFLTQDMPAYRESNAKTFGKASPPARRAYVFFSRVLDHARATISDPSQVLALVLAHELGHLLLPDEGHSRGGIMRAEWGGSLFDVPPFSRAQAATIRARLAANP